MKKLKKEKLQNKITPLKLKKSPKEKFTFEYRRFGDLFGIDEGWTEWRNWWSSYSSYENMLKAYKDMLKKKKNAMGIDKKILDNYEYRLKS